MATSLEHRRQAIAAALRAVMAEPLPTPPAPTEPLVTVAALPERPSLRDTLAAQIDWDEPEHLEALDDLDRSPDDLSSLEDFDGASEATSVPPLEVSGSMSRAASMALFGHA
jgi:hypothetical protein